MDKSLKILVTGGTGFIGSYILRTLIADGFTQVNATFRSTSTFDLVEAVRQKVKWVEADLLDIHSIYEVTKGVEIVIHAAAYVTFAQSQTQMLEAINVQGTKDLVNACLENQVEKLVHVSSIAVFGRDPQKRVAITESTDWSYDLPSSNYAVSKYESEMEVWRGQGEGLKVSVINPSLVLGSGFWHAGSVSLFQTAYKGMPFYPKGKNGFVDVRDVARAAVRCMDHDTNGERFIISGENLTYRLVLNQIASALGKKPPKIPVNSFFRELALIKAFFESKLSGEVPVLTRTAINNASRDSFFDNSKSIKSLRLTYIPIETTIQQTCQQLMDAANDDFRPRYLTLDHRL